MSENIERTETPVSSEKEPFWKRIPVMSVPAVIALLLMAVVFLLTFWTSLHKLDFFKGLWTGPYIGTKYYRTVLDNGGFIRSLGDSLAVKMLILGVCGALSAAFCALYRVFNKPGTILTLACLWLVPVCLPTIFTGQELRPLIFHMGPVKSESVYLFAMGLQTIGMFCFAGGIFAYLNMLKTQKVGKAPFMGLLAAVLVFLLGSLSTNGMFFGIGTILTKPFDSRIPTGYKMVNNDYFQGNAWAVVKIVLQILIGLVPAFFLRRMVRNKAGCEQTPKFFYVMLPAALAGVLLVLFASWTATKESLNLYEISSVNTLIVTLACGAFGGLVAWSFIHLLKRSSAGWYAVIGLVLSAALSCINMQYVLIIRYVSLNSLLPQVLFSAFDWRGILLVIILALVLRTHKENVRSGYLALALCLLIAAFAWGQFSSPEYMFNRNMPTFAVMYYEMFKVENLRPAMDLQFTFMTAVPPLLLGLGAALLMRRAFKEAE